MQVTPSAADWERTMTTRIGAAIKTLRNLQDMSAQKLSDRLTELGLDISRASISALENGRRPYITVTEVMLFARALNTSPIALIFPGPRYADTTEVLPNVDRIELSAVRWFAGDYVVLDDSDLTDDRRLYAANLRALRLSRYLADGQAQAANVEAELAIANSTDVDRIKMLTTMRDNSAKMLAELDTSLQEEIERRGG